MQERTQLKTGKAFTALPAQLRARPGIRVGHGFSSILALRAMPSGQQQFAALRLANP
jgi:hypothetical protein